MLLICMVRQYCKFLRIKRTRKSNGNHRSETADKYPNTANVDFYRKEGYFEQDFRPYSAGHCKIVGTSSSRNLNKSQRTIPTY